jgi:hypothetical protein
MADESRRVCAEYLVSMCSELAKMAEHNEFSVGAALLKMASIEFLEQQDSLLPVDEES